MRHDTIPFARYKRIPEIKPDFDRLWKMLSEDCISTKYRKIPSHDHENRAWIVGINDRGQICPEEIWEGNVSEKGKGYSGMTLTWTLESGEVFSLVGPGRSSSSSLVMDTPIKQEDVRPRPMATVLHLREMNPGPRRHAEDFWLKKYVYADEKPRTDKGAEELAMEFFEKWPEVDEVCYETMKPFSKDNGCISRPRR